MDPEFTSQFPLPFVIQRITIGSPKDGSLVVNMLDLSRYIKSDPEIIDSLIDLLFISFNTKNIGIDLPTRIYLLTQGKEVVATAFLTPNKSPLPYKYQSILNGYYIYNVCTSIPYRGKGIMKKLLTYVLQDDPIFPDLFVDDKKTSICYPDPVFYLQVDPNNIPAVRLYCRVGFKNIGHSETSQFDIFEWTNLNVR